MTRYRTQPLRLIAVAMVAALACPQQAASAEGACVPPLPLERPADIQGPARVIDGDTLQIGTVRIRLNGIDAPEMSTAQGPAAADAMRGLVGSKSVSCVALDRDRYGRTVARCTVDEDTDLAAIMIGLGRAKVWDRYLRGMPHRDAYRAIAERCHSTPCHGCTGS